MSNHYETQFFKEFQSGSLLHLVKEHKKNCDGKCGISLFLLFQLYRELKGESAIQDMEHFI